MKYKSWRKSIISGHKEGEDKVAPDLFLMHPCNNIPANIAIEFGLKGPNTIIPTACAAGNYAIGYAYDLIKFGRVDMMLAGGSDPFRKLPTRDLPDWVPLPLIYVSPLIKIGKA